MSSYIYVPMYICTYTKKTFAAIFTYLLIYLFIYNVKYVVKKKVDLYLVSDLHIDFL